MVKLLNCQIVNFKTALAIVFALIVLLGVTQLVLANEMSTEGRKIRELEEQKCQLENEVRTLEKEVSALGALSRIKNGAENLGLSYNPQIFDYLSPPKLAQAP